MMRLESCKRKKRGSVTLGYPASWLILGSAPGKGKEGARIPKSRKLHFGECISQQDIIKEAARMTPSGKTSQLEGVPGEQ